MTFNAIQYSFQLWVTEGNSPLKFREFKDEYSKFIFIGRILKSYKLKNNLNIRLLLNHIIILYNIFGEKITPLFFLTTDESVWPEIHAILQYLNRVPIPPTIVISEYAIVIDLNEYPANIDVIKLLETL